MLSEARRACGAHAGYLDELIAFWPDQRSRVADGASWMLKAELEDGASLTPAQTERLVAGLADAPSCGRRRCIFASPSTT